MKIIHIVDYFHPTMGYQENHLSLIQARSGHNVWVVSSNSMTVWPSATGSDGHLVSQGDENLASSGVRVVRLPAYFEISNRVLLKGLGALLRDIVPDLIHVHSFASLNALLTCRLKAELNYKLIVDDHMLFVASRARFARLFHLFFRASVAKYIFQRSDAVVAVTKETKQFMMQKYGLPDNGISIIPLGVNTDIFFPSSESRRKKRSDLGVSDDNVVFIYTGKLNRTKDPLRALKAVNILKERFVNFRFILVGFPEPIYLEEVRAYIIANGLSSLITIKNGVPTAELASFFNAADVAVWPTNCSMSSLEAMACACPVILADLGANLERLAGDTGLSFRDGDTTDLADKMAELILNPELRNKLAQNAVKCAAQLSWAAINDQFFKSVDETETAAVK